MKTGSQGTFVISWSQTETDGLRAASLDVLAVGATWRWTGVPVRVDGPQGVLLLEGAEGATELRKRAAKMVRRLIGVAVKTEEAADAPDAAELPDQSFVVTDGHQSHTLTLLAVPDTGALLVMVLGDLPPANQDMWVVRTAIDRSQTQIGARSAGGVICFTPDTRIATPAGPRLVQTLREGDLILTRDNGPQPVLWMGHRRMSGARLHAMPHLRPVRIKTGAFGPSRPDGELLVSPQHRVLIKGPSAQALFNVDEVLVKAEDMLNDTSITIDRSLREVTYIHAMLDRHNIIWANGLETESFHPSNAAIDMIEDGQRSALLNVCPDLAQNPQSYGDYARRNLSTSETAILRHDMAF